METSTEAVAAPSTASMTVDQVEQGAAASKRFQYAPDLSKKSLSIGGLLINVFGLEQLTPIVPGVGTPAPPEVLVVVHMHGRGDTADYEEDIIVRQLYERQRQRASTDQYSNKARREMLLVTFDAPNHGHRLVDPQGQLAWKDGNTYHAMDHYGMLLAMANDVRLIADLLPAYLFPHDERQITTWAVMGRSLGGHATWHVLAHDPRFTIGIPWLSCPDFATLMIQRAHQGHLPAGPPYLPASLMKLIARVDPVAQPFDQADGQRNPFWGKRICIGHGQEDNLVPWSCGQDFFTRLIVAPPALQPSHLHIILQPGIGHEVTTSMVEEAAHFLYHHGIVTATSAETSLAASE